MRQTCKNVSCVLRLVKNIVVIIDNIVNSILLLLRPELNDSLYDVVSELILDHGKNSRVIESSFRSNDFREKFLPFFFCCASYAFLNNI